jgi:hypothetical protein
MGHVTEPDQIGERRQSSNDAPNAPHPDWDAALAAAAASVRTADLVLIVGGPGTGKSLLLARLSAMLATEGLSVAHLRHAGDGAPPEADILLVDEADKRSAKALAELSVGRASCVLAGLPPLQDAVRTAGGEPVVIALGPLGADDVGGFVRASAQDGAGRRLDVADDAVVAFAAASRGVPRDLHILTGLAGFGAGLEGGGRIEARHVRAAAAMRLGAEEADGGGTAAVLGDLDAAPAPSSPDPAPPSAPSSASRRSGRRAPAAASPLAIAALAIAAAASFAIFRPASPPAEAPAAAPETTELAPAPVPAPAPETTELASAPPVEPVERPARSSAPPATPSAAAPVASPAMPPLAAPRILVTYPSDDPAGPRGAQEAAARLARLGWDVAPPRARTPPSSAGGGVAFYFAEDAAFAAAVAEALGGGARQASGSARSAQRSPGTVEVALPIRP